MEIVVEKVENVPEIYLSSSMTAVACGREMKDCLSVG